jgi:carbamoyltransferase
VKPISRAGYVKHNCTRFKVVFIGLTIGHDASAAFCDEDGTVLFAAAEERYSRLKNHLGTPYQAIVHGIAFLKVDAAALSKAQVFVAGDSSLSPSSDWLYCLYLEKDLQTNLDIFNSPLPPGLLKDLKARYRESRMPIRDYFCHTLSEETGLNLKNIKFVNHHDAHAASAFWSTTAKEKLVVTMDGSGDGDCATASVRNKTGKVQELIRVRDTYSVGHLYSEVTKRYGFKESRHEGKVTGLAGFGKPTAAAETLTNVFTFREGRPRFRRRYRLDPRLWRSINPMAGFNQRAAFTLAVNRAEAQTEAYSDLALAAQMAIEKFALDLLRPLVRAEPKVPVAVAGGVFANVRLNGLIASNFSDRDFFVYPNMGDGGLAVGAVWEGMRISGRIPKPLTTDKMYLGTPVTRSQRADVHLTPFSPPEFAKSIIESKVVGILQGRMEFGPRALCHRSIIADPRDPQTNTFLNKRLSRTEFMPFAPVVRDVDAKTVFDINSDRLGDLTTSNFSYMTETCHVRDAWKNIVPAIVHVDGTARPQVLTEADNPLLYETLGVLKDKYNLPVVINTSFNAHEEPIIENEDQALHELERGRIDILISGEDRLTFK